MVLDYLLSKIIILNQASGFVGAFSNLEDDVINPRGDWFQYSNKGPDTLFTGIIITSFYVPKERNSSTS